MNKQEYLSAIRVRIPKMPTEEYGAVHRLLQ